MVRLNTNLFILDKLKQFPSDLFLDFQNQTFFALTKISLIDNSSLTIAKLAKDTGNDVLSLQRLKDLVWGQIKESYLKPLDSALRANKVTKTTKETLKKIKYIRDNFLANISMNANLSPHLPGDINIPLQELGSICKELNGLFDVLCFGHQRSVLTIDYNPLVQHPDWVDPMSDIEYFLDRIIQDSASFQDA